MMVSFVLSFFPRDVLDEILNLIESVSEDFPSYSLYYCFWYVAEQLDYIYDYEYQMLHDVFLCHSFFVNTVTAFKREPQGRLVFTKCVLSL